MGLKILVTGGAGFLGSSLCESLIEKGHHVVALDSLFRGTLENIAHLQDHPHFEFQKDDVRNVEALDACVESLGGLDVIYHLAAINGTKWFHEAAHSVIDVNINGTLRTLELAMAHEARYVLASSPEAFGEAEQQPIRNGNPMQFSDPSQHQRHSYGASKYLDEVAAQHAARDGLDVRIVRPFNAYGPRLNGGDYGQVVAMFFHSVLTSSTIHIHNNGLQTRSFTWIDDITEGFLKAGLLDEGVSGASLSGMAFNIGSTEEISILDLQKRVYEVVSADSNWSLPLPEIEFTDGYHGDSIRRWPDVSLAAHHLGWTPSTSLIDGLQSTWVALR
ncbi:MAG: SDR family NAD(P)-dependent oxidoreductase [Candidatus Poseidoniaceae archaeon]|jgi:nucleoside-diphosphate-sugar epimerase|nr:SDR family NAD(P)-dependent oxidoreductase [Candidatus Poseidoniaceae archaeon]